MACVGCSIAAAIASAMPVSQDAGGAARRRESGVVKSKSTLSGVYTKAQADRGEKTYAQHCETCHLGDLLGFDYNPPLAGDTFSRTWTGLTVGEIFAKTQQTMPKTAPGSLSAREYADVIGYVLSVNGLPGGETELPTEVERLKEIVIQLPDK
jgi:mono/diheme cytochrome c family protein